jgi:hypothetical protein
MPCRPVLPDVRHDRTRPKRGRCPNGLSYRTHPRLYRKGPCRPCRSMSAVRGRADPRRTSFFGPFLTRNRHLALHTAEAASVCPARRRLLDHLIRPYQQKGRNGKAERPGSLDVDEQFKLCRKFNRQIIWFGAAKDTIDIGGRAPK